MHKIRQKVLILFGVFVSSLLFGQTNFQELSVGPLFGSFNGCFLVQTADKKDLKVFRPQEMDVRYSPVGTFYPLLALISLEQGSINRLFNYLYWDKQNYVLQSWNRNQTLTSALKDSVEWYFEGLAEMTSLKDFSQILSNLNYGNADVSGDVFWSDSSLKISSREQLDFWTRFATRELSFKKKNIAFIEKKLMIISNSNVVVYGQEGTSGGAWFTGKQKINTYGKTAWFVGYLTSSTQTNVFACHLDGTRKKSGSDARSVTFKILHYLKLLP